eukprot:NODE_3203_length_1026_cov_19.567042_g2945_i0.p1 GENE.NODE_3203_length_1026_cov_19.567042_g2945_i0~~NODE_3203_length_1026_cov_19.567042_g2945_i0.p1  ORF type:complete len:151 (+),score=5.10 NODE_3203_length_1026_cov_19.567042_g2945_i0:226-678(+)
MSTFLLVNYFFEHSKLRYLRKMIHHLLCDAVPSFLCPSSAHNSSSSFPARHLCVLYNQLYPFQSNFLFPLSSLDSIALSFFAEIYINFCLCCRGAQSAISSFPLPFLSFFPLPSAPSCAQTACQTSFILFFSFFINFYAIKFSLFPFDPH